MRRPSPMLVAAAVFVAAGGFVHLREWLDTYRAVPAEAPGAAVVRIGFPVNAGVSAIVVVALLLAATGVWRAIPVIAGAALFQVGSLVALILTRTSSLAGWAEPVWTRGAEQTRAVEIGALVCLAAAALLLRVGSTRSRGARWGRTPACATS